MSSCYVSWKTSKTGESIPCYLGGKPSASLYNPIREAEQFATLVNEGYVVIVGLASALHIHEVKRKFPNNKVIVVEKNNESIDFILSKIDVNTLTGITITTAQELADVILQTYYPPLDGNFMLVPMRSWVDSNTSTFEQITKDVKNALEEVSFDISTQAIFGKVWHNNIMQNLKMCEGQHSSKIVDLEKSTFPTFKKAFIAGAGPDLETHFDDLKKHRDEYFIIATDTAYHALSEQEIESDIVVSIDAQHISHSHFMCKKSEKTIFAFDMCANSIAVKNIIERHGNICFFRSEHPLCAYADSWYTKHFGRSFFPLISSSGGTVTLTALHFAKFIGFSKIITGGCDFAYTGGKMYAKGIYMDAIFNAVSYRLDTTENKFSALMFRNELIDNNGVKTTQLLQVYKKHFDTFFCTKYTGKFSKELIVNYKNVQFPTEKFLAEYCENLRKGLEFQKVKKEIAIEYTLLPYVSWYAQKFGVQVKKTEIYQIGLNATIHL